MQLIDRMYCIKNFLEDMIDDNKTESITKEDVRIYVNGLAYDFRDNTGTTKEARELERDYRKTLNKFYDDFLKEV